MENSDNLNFKLLFSVFTRNCPSYMEILTTAHDELCSDVVPRQYL